VPAGSMHSRTGDGQRYAVISEFGLSGTHNVRWETSPMRSELVGGNPSANSSSKATAGSGCMDMSGKNHGEGEEYQRPNKKFWYKCANGQEEVVACVGSNRTNNARIAVGQKLDVDGLWHNCEVFSNGSALYTQETSCASPNGKTYKVGDEVQVGFMRLQCQEHGYKVVGCFYLDDNNKPVSMNPGEKKEVGKAIHSCEEKSGTLQYSSTGNGCTKNGTDYKEGEKFQLNHITYQCTNGIADITGCFIDDKRPLTIGQDVVEKKEGEKGMVYRCYRLGARIEYNEYACGYNKAPSCTPAPIPQTPDEAPTLSRGLSHGFGTFAVAQQNGSGNVKLDLDKMLAGQQHQ